MWLHFQGTRLWPLQCTLWLQGHNQQTMYSHRHHHIPFSRWAGLPVPIFFLHLFHKKTSADKWYRFIIAECPPCHQTNSGKALTATQSNDPNLVTSCLHQPLNSWRKERCALYAGYLMPVPCYQDQVTYTQSITRQP